MPESDEKQPTSSVPLDKIVSLLPCPFCNGEAEADWRDEDLLHRCLDCDSKGPTTDYEDYKMDDGYTNEKAVELANSLAWNNRCGMEITEEKKPALFAEIMSSLAMLARCGDMQKKKAKQSVKAVDYLKLLLHYEG